MGLLNFLINQINAATGRNQTFEELIAAGDISRVKALMVSRETATMEAIKEYDVECHDIMKRLDKVVKDKDGNIKDVVQRWKLPIDYPKYINEVALVFIYGRPVKWSCKTEACRDAFDKFCDVLNKMHFDAKIREAKRYAGAETQSALLFRVYRNDDGKSDCQIRVLARSKGDEIYTYWDIYENLLAAAWGYYAKEDDKTTTYHFDIFTPKYTYRCVKAKMGWNVTPEPNPIGKIPLIIFQQKKEWDGATNLIQREEYLGSHTADTNDYFADPYLVVNADIVKNMPKKGEDGKLLVTKGEVQNISNVAGYITWNNAPESKKEEIAWLQKHIMTKTFTPDLESLKSISNVSYKTLRVMLMLAYIKADKTKEKHDELLDRTASLVLTIIGNVLDVSLKAECEKAVIQHQFQEPFSEDLTETLERIVKATDAKIMSEETAIEQNPLVEDHNREKERLSKEQEERTATQRDIFGSNQNTDDVFGGAE